MRGTMHTQYGAGALLWRQYKLLHCNKTSWHWEGHWCWYQPCDRYAEAMSIIVLVQKNTKNYCQADQQIRRNWWKRPSGGLVNSSMWKQIPIPFSFFLPPLQPPLPRLVWRHGIFVRNCPLLDLFVSSRHRWRFSDHDNLCHHWCQFCHTDNDQFWCL